MRSISTIQSLIFLSLLTLLLSLGAGTAWLVFGQLPLGDFRGLVLFMTGLGLFYAYSIMAYRWFMRAFPLQVGDIPEKSRQEFIYHIYVLFYLMIFYPVMRSGILPTPLMRLFYLAIGTQMGTNTYCQGIIHDPPFVKIGNNSTIGQYAILVPHVIEGATLGHNPIHIGNNVTIGAHSSILSDVVIGDNAIIATGAVVTKGTRIGAGEVWGGVPAKRLKATALTKPNPEASLARINW